MKRFTVLLLIATILMLGIFVYWLGTVLLPIAFVEMNYTLKKTAQTAFGTTDIRRLLIPNITIGIEQKSTHPEGAIVIPALFMDEPIIYNVDPNNQEMYLAALKQGIAHAAGTKLPGYGGLGYYFAHSSSPSFVQQYNAVFYLLGKLKGGEIVSVWREGKKYDYTVTVTKITDPSDVSFLDESQYQKESIVLQTCWPPGTTNKRLLVFAEAK